ncbi:hypothetical protein ACYCCF_29905 [Streptomyces argenteolus]
MSCQSTPKTHHRLARTAMSGMVRGFTTAAGSAGAAIAIRSLRHL